MGADGAKEPEPLAGPLADPRRVKLLATALLVALLPLVFVFRGMHDSPFAKDLRDHPERYRDRDVLLVLNRVSQCGPGWIEAGEPGGTVMLAADPRFGLRKDEYVNLLVGWRGGRFEVLEVGRHATRGGKWLVSYPVLAVVGALALATLRWDRRGRGIASRQRRDDSRLAAA